MAKLTLTDLGFVSNVSAPVNANNTRIETAMENTLSRDGSAPNEMNANLDMNSHRVLNLLKPISATEPVRLFDLDERIGNNEMWASEAQASAIAAAASAAESASSAADAQSSEDDAEGFALAAQASATAAAGSATNASTQATNASNSASAAAGSASAASTSATNAGNSATAAAGSASAASTSATNAGNSATAASGSASAASTSATNASTSASNALTSANNAAASYDSFDDRYLGPKASAPTLDNDGNALITGALYFNSTDNIMYVRTSGAAWSPASIVPGAYVQTSGDTMTGDLSFNRAAGTDRVVFYKTAGNNRWGIRTTSTAEGGANAGSNFAIDRYNDAGTLIDIAFSINRATGVGTFITRPVFGVNTPWDSGNANFVGMVAYFPTTTDPAGFIKLNGALIDVASFAALTTVLYCGNTDNPTAQWGYRTNSTDTTRSTSGTHIRLPDGRGEFIRGFDNARGVDTGRNLYLYQGQMFEQHIHELTGYAPAGSFAQTGASIALSNVGNTNLSGPKTGTFGTETRPRNLALMPYIKF